MIMYVVGCPGESAPGTRSGISVLCLGQKKALSWTFGHILLSWVALMVAFMDLAVLLLRTRFLTSSAPFAPFLGIRNASMGYSPATILG